MAQAVHVTQLDPPVEHKVQTPPAAKQYPELQAVATVADEQAEAPVPQATQVDPAVQNPAVVQAALQAAVVEAAQAVQTLVDYFK